jgi:hypothetical protein
MNLEELKKEYANQGTRHTAYPIYVAVQRRMCVGRIADGCSVVCPNGGGETVIEYYWKGNGDPVVDANLSVVFEAIKNYYDDDLDSIKNEFDKVEEINSGYIWTDVEIFLTVKGAEEYMEANAHNLGECRTYVKWFETRNYEMRGLLKEIGFKTKD